MRDADMTVRVDAAGNLLGRYAGDRENALTVLIGSHLDTVPDGGRYDGVLGVLLGVATVNAFHRRGQRLPFAIDVIGFSEEEGVRYRVPYLGSLAACGKFDSTFLNIVDSEGVSMSDAFRVFDLDPARVGDAAYPPRSLLAYVEPHVEQGPILDSKGAALGVVTAIVGQSRIWVAIEGKAGHAGTEPMEDRRDALTAAAELVLEVERLGRATEGLRATVGAISAEPGATNVIPGVARFSVDVRHSADSIREHAVACLVEHGARIAERRGVAFRIESERHHNAVPADQGLTDLLAESIEAAGQVAWRLVSGAGHDAAVMASVAPMAMLFLRSPGGISHHSDECVRRDDVRAALAVLVGFLERLARQSHSTRT